MSFTDRKPFVVTEEQTHLAWSGKPDGARFRCGCCGYKFRAGNIARWEFTNDTPGACGNPFVCQQCDGPKEKIVARLRELEELKNRFGWVNG